MTKLEFFESLRRELADLPEDERMRTIGYFSEMIADRMEDGMSEEEAVADVGDPKEIAAQILLDAPLPKLVQQKFRQERRRGGVLITILLILGSPIWLSLLIALFAVVFSVYVVFWAVILSLFAVVLAIACTGLFLLVAPIWLPFSNMGGALISLGGGAACIGLTLFAFLGAVYVAKGLIALSRSMLHGIKRLFIRKKEAA